MPMLNEFTNPNVESWFSFIFRRKDSLRAVSLYFLSRRYSTSPRYFPLYNESREIRIVLFRGSRIPGVDRLILKVLPNYIKVFSRRFSRYHSVFLFSLSWSKYINSNQILNLDDPEFTEQEIKNILSWEQACRKRKIQTTIATTTDYIKDFFQSHGSQSIFSVIPQGHNQRVKSETNIGKSVHTPKLSLVYTSPYIHTQGDLHGSHDLWGADTLLEKVWAPIAKSNLFELHLIGELGANARSVLDTTNAKIYGMVSFSECAEILKNCDIGLYPREKDNLRQVQKISEYIGAGLAIVTFDLMDTSLVKTLGVGISVHTIHEFVYALKELEGDRIKLSQYKANSLKYSQSLSWKALGKSLDELVLRT